MRTGRISGHPRKIRRWRSLGRVLLGGVLLGVAWASPSTMACAGDDCTKRVDTPKKELLRMVRQDCGSCHGLTLKGGLGKPLLPGNLAGRDARTIAQIILDGIPGTPMPPWRGILTKRDALWIARKLKEGLPDASP